ncbi:AAA ATPase [Binucleata daphniae]
MSVKSREYEYDFLKRKFENFILHKQSGTLHVTGVPGSGKTHTIKKVIENIQRKDEDEKQSEILNCKETGVNTTKYIYINCNDIKNKRGIFYVIHKNIELCKTKKSKKIRMQKKKTKICYYEKCKTELAKKDIPYIIVLDEIDLLNTKNQDILYTLVNLPFFDNIQLFLVTISNSFHLEAKVASRIGYNKLTFKPYKSEELMNILDSNTETTKYIAKRIGAISGDVRRAINLNKECSKMSIVEVENYIRGKSRQLASYFLPDLTKYQKLFMLCNLANTKIDTYYEEFCSACKIRNIEEIDYLEFNKMIECLANQGFVELKQGLVFFYLLQDELENILRNDKIYKELQIINVKK